MTSKADYLKKYLSQAEGGGDHGAKKKKVKIKKRSNITIHDDDVDWRAIAPRVGQGGEEEEEEADPEDAPVVAEVHDEQAPKWQSIEMKGFKPIGSSDSTREQDVPGGSRRGASGTPDASPPRRSRRHDSPDISPPRGSRRHDSPGISPPRGSRRHDSPDISPPRKSRRHDSPDTSPPRKSKKQDSPDVNPRRKSRKQDSPDISPPRKSRRQDSPDISPPRRSAHRQTTRKDDTRDQPHKKSRWDRSPEGQKAREQAARRGESPNLSPLRKRGQEQSPDLSPPRRNLERGQNPPREGVPLRRKHEASRDLSPPRRTAEQRRRPCVPVDDLNPPRRQKPTAITASPPRNRRDSPVIVRRRHDSSDSDLSPPRRGRHDSPEQSPPREPRTRTNAPSKPRRERPQGVVKDLGDARGGERMSSGARSGLQLAEVLKEENALVRERQSQFYQELDASMSGRHAETVYRDKSGRRIDPRVEEAKKMEEARKRSKDDEQFMEWGRGVAQVQMAHEKVADELYEMSKPLARYADDEDLERMLKEREREGDPMLAFIKKKVSQEQPLKGGKMKKGKPTYSGSFPPNRFGIRPGYRWDGVDRSNGFEKAWFTRQANKQATADEAYKWSVEDM